MLFNVKSRRYTNMATTATSIIIIIHLSSSVQPLQSVSVHVTVQARKGAATLMALKYVCMHALTEWSSNKCVQVVVAASAERLRVESVDILH